MARRASLVAASMLAIVTLVAHPASAVVTHEVTIDGPTEITIGQSATFTGDVTTLGIASPLTPVELLVDGTPVTSDATDLGGSYALTHIFDTAGLYAVRARASGGTPLAATSPAIDLHVGTEVLTVVIAGTGTGSVTSTQDGIDCGAVCTAEYPHGVQVELSATAGDGSDFASFSAPCAGPSPCTVTMDGPQTIVATFDDVEPPAAPELIATTPGSPSNVNTPTVHGTAQPGATIELFTNGTCDGEAAATGVATDGMFSIEAEVPEDATTEFSATAADPGGTGPCSDPLTYVEDSFEAAPTITGIAPGSPADDNEPLVMGTTGEGTTITLYASEDCSGPAVATGSGAGGAFSITVSVADDTTTSFSATATDVAGNTSECSDAVTYVEDSTAPDAPALDGTTPASPANNNTPSVDGTAEPGATVAIFAGGPCIGSVLASGVAGGDGAFSISVSVADDSTTVFHAAATDAAGNTGGCSNAVTYVEDSTAPIVPSITDSVPTSPSSTNDAVLNGSGEDASSVRLFASTDCSGAPLDATTVASGAFSFAVSVPDDSTNPFSVDARDAVGNTSACSAPFVYVEDSTPPPIELIGTEPASPSSVATPTLHGTTQPGSTVEVFNHPFACDGAVVFTGVADGTGAVAIEMTVPENSRSHWRARATDQAGNVGPCSDTLSYTHDSIAPDPPSFFSRGRGVSPRSPANHNEPTLGLFVPEAAGVVELFAQPGCAGAPVESVSIASPFVSIPTTVEDDTRTIFTARSIDEAGNVSECSNEQEYVEDSTPPAPPILDGTDPSSPSKEQRPRLLGSAEDDASLTIYQDASCTTSLPQTGHRFSPFPLIVTVNPDTTTTIHATATDLAGNVGGCSNGIEYLHDGTPPVISLDATTPASPANHNQPVIDGSAEPGAFVELFANGCPAVPASRVASGTADPSGAFSFLVDVDDDSITSFQARASDAVNNISACTSPLVYVEDSTPPVVTLTGTDPASPANHNTPAVEGTTDPDADVELFAAAACAGPVVGSASGPSFAIAASVADDTTTTFTARATDAAGNVGACSDPIDYVEDSIAPPAPTLDGTDPPSPANDNDLDVLGSAEADATVELFADAACSVPLPGAVSGAFPIALSVADDTTTTIHAAATDAAGNTSACSAGIEYIEDSSAPTISLDTTDPLSPANHNDPTVHGTTEAGATVELFTDACSGAPVDTGSTDGAGAFSFTVSVADDSTTAFHARATDATGNASACSAGLTYIEDSTAPVIDLAAVTPASPANHNLPEFSGTTEAGTTVELFSNALCAGTPAGSGAGPAFAISATVDDDTTTTFYAHAFDAAGNVSACSPGIEYVEDSTAPAVPSLDATDPVSPANDNDPEITGTSDADATVELFTDAACAGAPAGSAPGGSFAIVVGVPDDSTTTFHARATDAAGNQSACSAGLAYVEDSAAPAAPSLDGTTPTPPSNVETPTLNGAAEAEASIDVFVDAACTGGPAAAGAADGTGAFAIPVTVGEDATSTLYARATDAAGNRSACSAGLEYIEDSTPPAAPTIDGPPSPSFSHFIRIVGTAETASTVRVYKTTDCSGSAFWSGDGGSYTSNPTSVPQDATTWFTADAVDAAGNVSACSAPHEYIEDSTEPDFDGITSATAVGLRQIDLTWPDATDTVTPTDQIEYAICRSTGRFDCRSYSVSTTLVILTGGPNSYSDTDVEPGTRYYYAVRAIDEAGNLEHSAAPLESAVTLTEGVNVQVAAGINHTCAVRADGTASCWGRNTHGQLGNGAIGGADPTPGLTADLPAPAAAISPGFEHTCALLVDRSVACWGRDHVGQLGDGTITPGPRPIPLTTASLPAPATAISAGAMHTCAVLAGGAVACWGSDADGQLGDGTGGTANPTPTATLALPVPAVAVAAGGAHTCAVLADGSVACWGDDTYGQLGDGTAGGSSATPTLTVPLSGPATAIAAGARHTCALLADGAVSCWGDDDDAQLGDGSPGGIDATPTAAALPAAARAISAGSAHSCAVLVDGTVVCWGANAAGQIGRGNRSAPVAPTVTDPLPALARGIAAGGFFTCAVLGDGTIACWGDDLSGQLGDGAVDGDPTTSPAPTVPLPGVLAGLQLSSGELTSCVLVSDGTLRCWGFDADGQIGDGEVRNPQANITPKLTVPLPALPMEVGNAAQHTCAVLLDGTVACWGSDRVGQLGVGTTGGPDNPTPARTLPLPAPARSVSDGPYHTCAVLVDGTVACWGDNDKGELGDGSTVGGSNGTPTRTAPLPAPAVAVSAATDHTCALLADGTVACWGYDFWGTLGDGTARSPTSDPTPRRTLPLPAPAIDVAAGRSHTCVLLVDGTAQCFGWDHYGVLGDGVITPNRSHPNPSPTATLPDLAVAISAGNEHTCVELADTSVACWGRDDDGELGDGTVGPDQPTPTRTAALPGSVIQAETGASSTCVLIAGGRPMCWGADAHGNLGNGRAGPNQAEPNPAFVVEFP